MKPEFPLPALPRITSGQLTVLMYLAIAYLIPIVGNAFFSEELITGYVIGSFDGTTALVLFGTVVSFLIFSASSIVRFRTRQKRTPLSAVVEHIGAGYTRSRLLFGITALIVAVSNLASGLNGYRYSDVSISELRSPQLLLGAVITSVLMMDVFYTVFVQSPDRRVTMRTRIENIIVAMALMLSASGTVGMITALCAAGPALAPGLTHRVLFASSRRRASGSAIRWTAAAIAIVLVLMTGWLGGETIKGRRAGQGLTSSALGVLDRVRADEEFGRSYALYLLERISVHYYSLQYVVKAPRSLLNGGELNVTIVPLRNLRFRIDYLLGSPFGYERPELSSLNQLNYQLLSAGPISNREGSSPGLIASFVYVFPVPLDIIFCGFYAAVIARAIDGLVSRQTTRLALPGVLLSMLFIGGFFMSPFDLLNLVDEGGIQTVSLLGILIAGRVVDSSRNPAKAPTARRLVWDRPPARTQAMGPEGFDL